ncbi:penicillin-binding protein 2 [Kutzneria viridogrisea]|uniref:Penicillin-binding protein A n=2 Tax=Kutzneria TaxID=43356 RepID=W5VY90_9PSEU|nr:penicillin-binding protein 2 [Kutzneria albida]AHH93400.1 Penicillin-binding protein A [Kutzneria albida DSM 43870]MBA8929215.1 peptidoglycan glycosyltransferase [Kutzneria viridogrisea]
MNKPLRRVGLAMMVMVLLLLANLTYVQVIKADTYASDPSNRRSLLEEYSRQRGQIVSSTGTILANSVETKDSQRFLRQYPNGAMYAPITGYYSSLYGASGIESAEDDVLNGSSPKLFVRRLSDLITGRDPRGGNVKVTIDPKAQAAAYNAMTAKGYTGSVVAIKPSTGEILAMVSTPSYDPNPLSSHSSTDQSKLMDQLNKDQNQSGMNRAIREKLPPGSTFKLVVGAAALSNGTADATTPSLPADASITLPGTSTPLANFANQACPESSNNQVSMTVAMKYSCNTAFSTLAGKVGKDNLIAQAAKFGIGQTDLSIPLSVVPSTVGSIPDQAALYQTGIGQRDVALTPLQDAVVAATIANGGVRMQPQLVKDILAPDMSSISSFSPEEAPGGPAVSKDVANQLRDMMIQSEQHTGGEGKVAGRVIASKTGTAEHGTTPKQTPPHAWYVAFTPADNQQIAVCVVVENGGDRGLAATGGSVAAGIGRATINAYLSGG